MSTCMRGSRGTDTSTRLPVQRGRGALRVLSTALSTEPDNAHDGAHGGAAHRAAGQRDRDRDLGV